MSTTTDSTPRPPRKRAKKTDAERVQDKVNREYEKLVRTCNGFYLKRWKVSPEYIEGLLRCDNSNKTVVLEAAKFAVSWLNEKKKNSSNNDVDDNLRLVRVVRSNFQMCGRYYITLEASDGNFYETRVVIQDEEDDIDYGVDDIDYSGTLVENNEVENVVVVDDDIDDDYDYDGVDDIDDLGTVDDDDDDDDDDIDIYEGNEEEEDEDMRQIDDDYTHFKLEMIRIALHYPAFDETYGPH